MLRSLFIFKLSFMVFFSTISTGYTANEANTLYWAGCGITKKAFMAELAKAYERETGVKIILQGGGATKGIRKVSSGELHIGGACRVALERHPLERNAQQVPVAWDALVVIVNKNNPVDTISLSQLRDIYLGKVTNWQELGGIDSEIELYIRRGNLSGVGRTLRELVFANFDQKFTGAKYIERSSGPVEKGVVKNRGGIGVTGVSSARKRDVKILKLQGIEPTYDNIKSGSYLLYRPLYLVRQSSKSSVLANKFITFALSRRGKDIIRKAGTVPYSDALVLVMKQLEQQNRATRAGLHR